ncbi:MAG: caspase family protein [Ferruginibacter sp.]
MLTPFSISLVPKSLKNRIAGVILILLSLLVSSNSYIQPGHTKSKAAIQHKNEPKPRMFLITVIDSYDDTIGRRCETDMEDILFAFEELSDWLDVKMENPKIISGDKFSKAGVNDAIDNWLRSQRPTKIDIVVFYYSGHGFRYPGDASEYPRMWLKTNTDRNTSTTNLRMEQDIYDRIIKMGAGVNIVLSDCCNTSVVGETAAFDEINVPIRKRVSHKKPEEDDSTDDIDNADRLFIPPHPLSILATAAGRDEFAGGKTETGGFFTNYLLDALDQCIFESKLDPTWQSIFEYVDENAGYWARSAPCPTAKHNEQGRCVQMVKFKVEDGD